MKPIAYIYKKLHLGIFENYYYRVKSITFYHENLNYIISFQKEKYG
jgi:hypothetical protein